MMKKVRLYFVFEKLSNFLAAAIYGWMAYNIGINWLETGRLSSAFFLALESVIIILFLIRDMPKKTSMQPFDWFVALMGTVLPLLLRAVHDVNDVSFLLVVQLAGVVFTLVAVLFLNRSFGFLPANRGVKRGGLYRYVRHPVYAGYIVANGAFALQNISRDNITVMVLFLLFIVLRIFAEEKLLAEDPAYAAYMKQTRWRLLPGAF